MSNNSATTQLDLDVSLMDQAAYKRYCKLRNKQSPGSFEADLPLIESEKLAFVCGSQNENDQIRQLCYFELVYRDDHGLDEYGLPTADTYVLDRNRSNPASLVSENALTTTEPNIQTEGSSAKKESKDTIPVLVYEALFARHVYRTILGKIYWWNIDHYEEVEKQSIRQKIQNELKCSHRPHATSANVTACLQWFMDETYYPLSKVNQGGINLANGILQIEVINGSIDVQLVEHNPEYVFLSQSPVYYNPKADRKYANQLLQCMDEPYRTIWLRNIAATLGLHEVRKRWSRCIKALIMYGSGANGKDSLMAPVEQIFSGGSLSHISLAQLLKADAGNSFVLTLLLAARLNHSNEAKGLNNLPNSSVIKQLVTGDTMCVDVKNRDPVTLKPNCVMVFSTNESPDQITGALQASTSRYALLPFLKSYVQNPTKSNELQADPRFHDDESFIRHEVAPALLNILIEEYENLIKYGIDYSVTDQQLQDNRYESDRLYAFVIDGGFAEGNREDITPQWKIWDAFLQGCARNEISDIDRKKARDLPSGKSELTAYLKKSFPNIESIQIRCPIRGKIRAYRGIQDTKAPLPYKDFSQDSIQDSAKTSQDSSESVKTELSQPVSAVSQSVSEEPRQLKPLSDKEHSESVLVSQQKFAVGDWVFAKHPQKGDQRSGIVTQVWPDGSVEVEFIGGIVRATFAQHEVEPDDF